jgi:hypothetical protein
VQDKKASNQKVPKGNGSKNSWLTGLAKCGLCGYALAITYTWNTHKTKRWRYWMDRGEYTLKSCVKKRLKIKPDETEQIVYTAMQKRIKELEIAKRKRSKPNPETESINTVL